MSKTALRWLAERGLFAVRGNRWLKSAVWSLASLVPPVKRKLLHFATVRTMDPAAFPGLLAGDLWYTDVDPQAVAEWDQLLKAARRGA